MAESRAVVFDTAVLVAAMVQSHTFHARAFPWLARVKRGELEGAVASHTLAELYAVLTTLPVTPRIAPGTAWRLIRENVEHAMRVVSLSSTDYRSLLRRLAELGIAGGAVYDAVIARAAEKIHAQRVLTFDLDDFQRVWPEGDKRLSVP